MQFSRGISSVFARSKDDQPGAGHKICGGQTPLTEIGGFVREKPAVQGHRFIARIEQFDPVGTGPVLVEQRSRIRGHEFADKDRSRRLVLRFKQVGPGPANERILRQVTDVVSGRPSHRYRARRRGVKREQIPIRPAHIDARRRRAVYQQIRGGHVRHRLVEADLDLRETPHGGVGGRVERQHSGGRLVGGRAQPGHEAKVAAVERSIECLNGEHIGAIDQQARDNQIIDQWHRLGN